MPSFYRNLTSVLLVIAGRDRLTWHELDRDWADPESLEQHRLGGLYRQDGSMFLEKCGIGAGGLQDAILRISVDEKLPDRDGYYPFSLGLLRRPGRRRAIRGNEPDPATFDMAPNEYGRLAQRFLKSLHDRHSELWITLLAHTPRFDEAAVRDAFSSVHDVQQDAAWDSLQLQLCARGRPAGLVPSSFPDERGAAQRPAGAGGFAVAHNRWQAYWRARA